MSASKSPSSDIRVQTYVKLVRMAEEMHASVSRGLLVEGLTASQFSVLKVLHFRGKLAQRDIAQHILKTGGNVTLLVDNLERDGLVIRERDTVDRRVVYVQLTEQGSRTFADLYPAHLERIKEVFEPLSPEQCEQLSELLEALAGLQNSDLCVTS